MRSRQPAALYAAIGAASSDVQCVRSLPCLPVGVKQQDDLSRLVLFESAIQDIFSQIREKKAPRVASIIYEALVNSKQDVVASSEDDGVDRGRALLLASVHEGAESGQEDGQLLLQVRQSLPPSP